MSGRTRVAGADEIEPGQMRAARLQGRPIVLANVAGEFYAFQNECLHARVRLSEGRLDGDVVACRWHQWRYRVTTGEVLTDEAPYATLTTFPVRVENDDVFVEHEPRTRIRKREVEQ